MSFYDYTFGLCIPPQVLKWLPKKYVPNVYDGSLSKFWDFKIFFDKMINGDFVSILMELLCPHLLLPQMGRSALPSAAYFFEPLFRLRPGGRSIERVLAQVSHQIGTMAGTLWQLKKL
jgi:hypothetical protein